MASFTELWEKDREWVISIAEKNTLRNKDGEFCMSMYDPWIQDKILDEDWNKFYLCKTKGRA